MNFYNFLKPMTKNQAEKYHALSKLEQLPTLSLSPGGGPEVSCRYIPPYIKILRSTLK